MAFSLTPRQLMQAKEAIEILSNLSGEGQSTSGLAAASAAATSSTRMSQAGVPAAPQSSPQPSCNN